MNTEEYKHFYRFFFPKGRGFASRNALFYGTNSSTSLQQLFDYFQHNLSLNVQRILLILFIILQVLFFTGYSVFQRARIEDDAARILRNTALLKAQLFETSMAAMSYQMQSIGDAILLNYTIRPENTVSFLAQELKQDWLDAVVVFNAQGDFVARNSVFPLEHVISSSAFTLKGFHYSPLFTQLRREEVKTRLFYWHGSGLDEHIQGLAMYRAVYDHQGRYLGGAVGYFKSATLGYLNQRMEGQGLDLGPGGVIELLDYNTGFIIVRIGWGSHISSGGYQSSELMKSASDIATVQNYTSSVDEISRLGVFLNINDRKWVLAMGLAVNDILHDWYIQTILSALVVLIMAILQWQLLHYAHINFLQRERLILESRRDPLTHLPNRRYFDEWVHKLCSMALRNQEPLSILCLDLDYFKKINDSYGHDGGDVVLKQTAYILKDRLRESDIAARFGGEEFVVALPNTDLSGALRIAERIRFSFAEQRIEFKGQLICFTASFGVARMTLEELKSSDGIRSALTRADQALYRSKQNGRNQVTAANEA